MAGRNAWKGCDGLCEEEAKAKYVQQVEEMAAGPWAQYKEGGAEAMPEGAGGAMGATGAGPVFSSAAVDAEEAAYDRAMQESEQKTLLFLVAEGDLAGVKKLLKGGADVSQTDEEGLTPLHFAADRGNGAIAQLLVEAKADVNAKSSDGDTPLHNAVLCEYLELVRFLMANGANPTLENNDGESSLVHAADNDELLQLLNA